MNGISDKVKNKNIVTEELVDKVVKRFESKIQLMEAVEKGLLSEGLKYHVDNKLSLDKNVYRPLSKEFMNLFVEARNLYNKNVYVPSSNYERFLLESDIGEYGIYEGKRVPLDFPYVEQFSTSESIVNEAEYKGKDVELNKPKRGGPKKFFVYVKDPQTGNVKKVSFGDKGMSVKVSDPAARKSFAARHKCPQKKDKTTPGYWSCRVGRYPALFGGKSKYTWW
jgi:hypothetical protein